jgi:putative ABC transport system permease protein
MDGYTAGEEPEDQITRYDAEALLRDAKGDRQALMTGGGVGVQPERQGLAPFAVDARYTSADLFPMFDVPMLHGNGWSKTEDDRHGRVAVITKALSDKLYGTDNAVGRTLRMDGHDFRVVGVMDQWRPTPKFFDLNSNRYGEVEQIYLPFSTSRDLDLGRNGSMNCWDDGDKEDDPEGETGVNAPCTWMQYWVQLDSPDKVEAYKRYLTNYSDQQRASGRYERPTNVRLRSLMEWLDYKEVVPSDVRLQVWLALGFLSVCLLNTVGLLLAKFLRRSSEIGVRRALGASRRDIFAQCLVEAGTVGLAGGVLGLGLAMLGLWGVRQQPASYADLAHLDPVMLVTTFVLAIAASVLAGLVPAWHACQVTPAVQLKSQ